MALYHLGNHFYCENFFIRKVVMKILLISICFIITAKSYMINGMYATMESCRYEQFGYEFGYVGYYRGNDNNLYIIFFGKNYCEF